MYRLIVETLLGVHLEVDKLRITPCIADGWDSYKVHYRYRETAYHITVKPVGDKAERVIGVTVDGADLGGKHDTIPLVDDRRDHQVEVALG